MFTIGATKLNNLIPTHRNPPASSNKNLTPTSKTPAPPNKNAPNPAPQQGGAGPSTPSNMPKLTPRPSQPPPKCVTSSIPDLHQVVYLTGMIRCSPAKDMKFTGYVFINLPATSVLTPLSSQDINPCGRGTTTSLPTPTPSSVVAFVSRAGLLSLSRTSCLVFSPSH